MPCRGTGKVVSNLGGTPSTVTCPWCEGSGVRMPGVDAQAKWLADEAGEQRRTRRSRIVHASIDDARLKIIYRQVDAPADKASVEVPGQYTLIGV